MIPIKDLLLILGFIIGFIYLIPVILLLVALIVGTIQKVSWYFDPRSAGKDAISAYWHMRGMGISPSDILKIKKKDLLQLGKDLKAVKRGDDLPDE